MGCKIRVRTSDCMNNHWKMCRGVYWATSGVGTSYAEIRMSKTGGYCPAGEVHRIKIGDKVLFGNGKYTATVTQTFDRGSANITIWKTDELEPDVTKFQIISNHSDKLGYNVGDIIKSECVIKNIGSAGTAYLTVGLGYIDSSNMISLTGFPTTDQLYLNYNQRYTFKEDVKVDITDYYRQRGIGWAYLQQQMYLFFLAGHKVDGNTVWDTERHIKIYLDMPEGFKDPTSLEESVIGDIPEIIEDAIPAFDRIGRLGGVIDDLKPDTWDITKWVADKLTPEPEPEEKEKAPDLMPFIYIGFAGLIGYLLIKGQ